MATAFYFGLCTVGLTELVLIALKLLGKHPWSWWQVLSPVWVLATTVAALIGLFAILVLWLSRGGRRDGRPRRHRLEAHRSQVRHHARRNRLK